MTTAGENLEKTPPDGCLIVKAEIGFANSEESSNFFINAGWNTFILTTCKYLLVVSTNKKL